MRLYFFRGGKRGGGRNDVNVELTKGIKWCQSEGVIFPRGENDVRVGISRGEKLCVAVRGYLFRG